MAFPTSGNGPRMFRNLTDSEFKNITAEARNNSEMFKDTENVVLHESKLKVGGRSYDHDQPPIEVETGILTPNLSAWMIHIYYPVLGVCLTYMTRTASSPPAIPRPSLLESISQPATMLGVPGVTGVFLEAPPLRQSTSNPISPSYAEAESTFASTMEPSVSAYSPMDEVGNTTADTTPESFNAYSAEPDADETDVNQAPAHDGSKKFKSR
jgi:hypothetical protein